MQKIILVIGATGTMGQPVSHSLKATGFRVRIMTRNLQKARTTFDNSFEMVTGNPMDLGCMEAALDGCHGVHISLPSEVEQQVVEVVAKVALRRKVERISYISGATVSDENRWFPMINRKFMAEKVIREAGIPYTIFCPTWIMESLPMFVHQGRASVLGNQPYPYHWIAADDMARMVSNAYCLEGAANKRFFTYGPEAIRMQEALGRYCSVFQPAIKKVECMPFWLVKLFTTVTGNQELKGAGELMSYFEKVGEMGNPAEANFILGASTITLDNWLKERKTRLDTSTLSVVASN